MTYAPGYSFQRYLAAKRSVDDRALNRQVWQTLAEALPQGSLLKVIEVGAGIGTMLERIFDWGLLQYASYTLLDSEPANASTALERLTRWASARGLQQAHAPGNCCYFVGPQQALEIHIETCDVFEYIEKRQDQPADQDLLLAHAFLDLVNIPAALPRLFRLVRPEGFFYFSLNFDGLTLLEPVIDPAFDPLVIELYHRTMDERTIQGKPCGDRHSGRRLFQYLPAVGAQIMAAGASDWVVFPGAGGYAADEAYFLHFILETIRNALQGHPALDPNRFAAWIATRHAQVERKELVFVAHQLDFTGKAL